MLYYIIYLKSISYPYPNLDLERMQPSSGELCLCYVMYVMLICFVMLCVSLCCVVMLCYALCVVYVM